MIEFLLTWYRRYLSDPQAVLLAVFLLLSFAVIFLMGQTLAPLLAAIVIGYLLEGLVAQMERMKVPRLLAVACVFSLFLAAVVFLVLGLIPLLYHQVADYVQGLPGLINDGQQLLLRMPEAFPGFVSTQDVVELTVVIRRGMADFGQNVLSSSLASIPAIMTALASRRSSSPLEWMTGARCGHALPKPLTTSLMCARNPIGRLHGLSAIWK